MLSSKNERTNAIITSWSSNKKASETFLQSKTNTKNIWNKEDRIKQMDVKGKEITHKRKDHIQNSIKINNTQ